MDEITFLEKMHAAHPDVFETIEGWTSHSYPNPGFVGHPEGIGRGTARTYLWELSYLGRFGKGHLPVFITETGWRHNGATGTRGIPSPTTVGNYLKQAYQSAWNDRRVIAVTPFLLNYQDDLFSEFSWRKLGSEEFHDMYALVQQMEKVKAEPKQRHRLEVSFSLPFDRLVKRSHYIIPITVKNAGQSIAFTDSWQVVINHPESPFTVSSTLPQPLEPNQLTTLVVELTTPDTEGTYVFDIEIRHQREVVSTLSQTFALVPPPTLLVYANTWTKRPAAGDDFKLLIYDERDYVVAERIGIPFKDGRATITELYDVIPDKMYRLVLIKPYYLPRQLYTRINLDQTAVGFPPLLPFDPSNDGTLTVDDIGAALKQPLKTLTRIMAL